MYSPTTGKKMTLLSEERTSQFGKDEIKYEFFFYLCTETGRKYEDFILEMDNLEREQYQYRKMLNPLV